MKQRAVTVVLGFFLAATDLQGAHLHEIARLVGGPAAGAVAVGDLVALGSGSRLVVIDTTEPLGPTTVAELALGGHPAPHDVQGCVEPLAAWHDRVLVASSCGWPRLLVLVDLTEPSAPTVTGSLELFDAAERAALVGSTAWVVAPDAVGDVIRDALLAVDLSGTGGPMLVGRYDGSSRILDVAADGDRIALIDWPPARLTLLDARSPAAPTTVSHTELDYWPALVELAGDTVFLANRDDAALEVVDVTDPSSPVHGATVPWTVRIASPADLLAVGTRLVLGLDDADPQIADARGGLEVFSLADPSSLADRQSIAFSADHTRLARSGDRLIVVEGRRGVRLFETDAMSSPIRPDRADPTFDEVMAVAVVGDLALLADHGLRIVDLGLGPRPGAVGRLELDAPLVFDPDSGLVVEQERTAWDVAAGADGLTALATSNGVLAVVDATDPSRPAALAQLAIPEMAGGRWQVGLAGSVAVAAGSGGLVTVDLSDPEHPAVLAARTLAGSATDLALFGAHAAVASGADSGQPERGAIDIVNLDDPADPVVVASIPFDLPIGALDAAGSVLVAVDREAFRVLDVSEPSAPSFTGVLAGIFAHVTGISVDGATAFVSVFPGSLVLVDLRDPAEPQLSARYDWQPWTPSGGDTVGGFDVDSWQGGAIVADGWFGLRIVGVSPRPGDPAPGPEAIISID